MHCGIKKGSRITPRVLVSVIQETHLILYIVLCPRLCQDKQNIALNLKELTVSGDYGQVKESSEVFGRNF